MSMTLHQAAEPDWDCLATICRLSSKLARAWALLPQWSFLRMVACLLDELLDDESVAALQAVTDDHLEQLLDRLLEASCGWS